MDKINIIRYTGFKARKDGNHTRKQFLSIMDKNFKKDCSTYIKSLTCKSCNKLKKMVKAKNFNNQTMKQLAKCKKCKNTNTKQCDFKKYIEFSGAKI